MSANRVRNLATNAIFKKWGFKNPDGILGDLNINAMSFTTTGTFRTQHKKLMTRVDDMLKMQGSANNCTGTQDIALSDSDRPTN